MRYRIVSEQSIEALEKSVAELLEVGWQPQGGIAFHDYDILQVVTHPEDGPTPLEIEQVQNQIAERLVRVYPILAIPEQDLTDQQENERQELLAMLTRTLDAIQDSKSEKDSD